MLIDVLKCVTSATSGPAMGFVQKLGMWAAHDPVHFGRPGDAAGFLCFWMCLSARLQTCDRGRPRRRHRWNKCRTSFRSAERKVQEGEQPRRIPEPREARQEHRITVRMLSCRGGRGGHPAWEKYSRRNGPFDWLYHAGVWKQLHQNSQRWRPSRHLSVGVEVSPLNFRKFFSKMKPTNFGGSIKHSVVLFPAVKPIFASMFYVCNTSLAHDTVNALCGSQGSRSGCRAKTGHDRTDWMTPWANSSIHCLSEMTLSKTCLLKIPLRRNSQLILI